MGERFEPVRKFGVWPQPEAEKPSRRLLRFFSASWSLFSGAGAWFAFRHFPHHASAWCWLLIVAGIFAIGLFFPATMKPVFLAVERLLKPVGEAISILLLAIVYFFVFTPFALVMRMAGRDLLRLKRSGWGPTAWEKKRSGLQSFGYSGQY